jgi:hypothetical protein
MSFCTTAYLCHKYTLIHTQTGLWGLFDKQNRIRVALPRPASLGRPFLSSILHHSTQLKCAAVDAHDDRRPLSRRQNLNKKGALSSENNEAGRGYIRGANQKFALLLFHFFHPLPSSDQRPERLYGESKWEGNSKSGVGQGSPSAPRSARITTA